MISANDLERPEPLRLALLSPGPLSQPVLGFPKLILLRVTLLQEGGAFPGPHSGLLSNTWTILFKACQPNKLTKEEDL